MGVPKPARKLTEAKSTAALLARTRTIIAGLRQAYPTAHCELNFSTPLELLVATILSAQCTDKRVNIVTAELFKRYRSAAAYADAPLAELEQAVRTTGFFRNKARNIQACCRKLVEQHDGEVPRTMEELHSLDGVGRKTANVVLGNAFNINVGVVVDTHVSRLSQRLGLTRETTPEHIEQALMKLVPREEWTLFSHWLIWHGRRRCDARKPDCAGCEIRQLCPSAHLNLLPAPSEKRGGTRRAATSSAAQSGATNAQSTHAVRSARTGLSQRDKRHLQ